MNRAAQLFVFCAACLAAALLSGSLGRDIRIYLVGYNSASKAELEEMIAGTPTQNMYLALKKYYPEDADLFIEELQDTLRDGKSREQSFQRMLIVGQEIRKKHAVHLLTAPDAAIRDVLRMQKDIIVEFEDEPEICNAVVMQGPGAIPPHHRHRIFHLLESVDKLYFAMHQGQTEPVQRQDVTDGDWERFFDDFFLAGGSEAQLETILSPSVSDENLCEATITFMDTLVSGEFPGAEKLRAETAFAVNSS